MVKQKFIVLKTFQGIDMLYRLVRCLIGWGTGIIIMGFPMLFLNDIFLFKIEIWKMFLGLYQVFFPVLLLVENIFYRYRRFSKGFQFIVLSVLFILAEIEFFYLPWKYTQVQYSGNWITNLTFWLFAIIAAFVVTQFLIPKRKLVIFQKEI